jgi:hypothetical protein
MAYLMTSRYAEALPILDGYLVKHPTEQDLLFAGVVAQYEVIRAGSVLSNTERDRVRRWAAAYKGDQSALVGSTCRRWGEVRSAFTNAKWQMQNAQYEMTRYR